MVSLKNQEIDFDYGTLQLAVKMICFFFFFFFAFREVWWSLEQLLMETELGFFVFVFFPDSVFK